MWQINANQVIAYGRTPGGDRFTEFVDSLIRAQAYLSSLPAAEIRTNLRTNIGDRGVDTEVCQPLRTDPMGLLLDRPSIWQYKAKEYADITNPDLIEEINKGYAVDRIVHGYAYRLCICDELPAHKIQGWETLLTAEARKINPDSPEAKVVSAGNLAEWASSIPSIALRYFLPQLGTVCVHLEAWKEGITEATPNFVPVPSWEEVRSRLAQHVDFSVNPPQVVFPISGEAGVGKTRLTYEGLSSLGDAKRLVIYTSDEENALSVARLLANHQSMRAILVADECSVIGRMQLQNILNGSKDRVRIISIDNSQERLHGREPVNSVARIPQDTVEVILGSNFPDVPTERRRVYSGLSGGFVRLAADLCRNDALIQGVGHVGPALEGIQAYLQARLSEGELRTVLALSLVTRVGTRGDVEAEINDLCGLTGLDRAEVIRIANELHDRPGFVARAGRFFYVTPEIVAQAAFDMAWNTWARHDAAEFLARIPHSVLESFNKRVARSANEEVRRAVGEFFRRWALSLEPKQLASLREVDRLVVLVEVEPETYLPILRQLIEQASIEELIDVTSEGVPGRWGPRRSLVWAAERLASFPEHFADAESILLRLALAESEPRVVNNATGIWVQLFGIELSGTAVPFPERLEILRERLKSSDQRVSVLALEALNQVFNQHRSRMVGPSVIGGRIPPEEWRPKTYGEYRDCMDRAVSLLQEFITESDAESDLRKRAQFAALLHSRILLRYRYLENLKHIFASEFLTDQLRIKLIQEIEDFLAFDSKDEQNVPQSYIEQVRDWLRSLEPQDFHGKLISLVGVDMWHHSTLGDEEEWQSQVRALAGECLENPGALKGEREWLFSGQAQSAFLLGQELGNIDKQALLLNYIIESSIQSKFTELARGYISRLLNSFPTYAERINQYIDDIQEEHPALAFELFVSGGDQTAALQRALRLVKSSKLSPRYLKQFVYYVGSRNISLDEVEQVLLVLVGIIESNENGSEAASVAIEFLGYRSRKSEVWEHRQIHDLAWYLMELTATDGGGEPYWWSHIITALADYDPRRAARIAASGIAPLDLRNFNHEDSCKKVLSRLAAKYPDEVMQVLGEVILDAHRGQYFYIGSYRSLIAALPDEVIIGWVEEHGIEAARRLARHLPPPYIGSGEKPMVPPLTEYIFRRFEDDDRVLNEFCAGVHSFQMYHGDIAVHHEREAQVAQRFLTYPLKRIREWALIETETARRNAESWRQHEEE